MISINKSGNAIVIEFTDNDKYLFDGTIEVAPNELMVVIDESDMATFKRVSNGDVLFSQIIDNIQISGTSVTKDNIIEQFGIIGYTSGGGGGTGAVSSVNGQTGDVVLTASSLNAYTKTEVNSLLDNKADYSKLTEEATEREKQDSALGGMIAAETEARKEAISGLETSKQDVLVSGTNIKTINGQTLLGEGNIQIEGGETITIDSELSETSENPVQNKVITEALNNKQAVGDYALKSEIPDTSGLATKEELTQGLSNKADVSSLEDYSTKEELNTGLSNKLDTSVYNSDKPTFATKTEIADMLTKTEASSTYQVKGNYALKSDISDMETKTDAALNYATKSELNTTNETVSGLQTSKQDTLVSGTNIKTVNGNSLLGEGNITIEGGGSSITLQEGGKGTGTNYIYSNTDEAKNNRAVITKIFMDRKLDSEDNIALYVNYWGTDGYSSYSHTNMHIPSATAEKAGLLSASDKQKLDSLNNVVDTSMSDTSTNPVQNNVIKTYVDGLVGDINTILDSINGEEA